MEHDLPEQRQDAHPLYTHYYVVEHLSYVTGWDTDTVSTVALLASLMVLFSS